MNYEERRNHPEIRKRVAEIHEERKAKLAKAAKVLEDLAEEMRDPYDCEGGAIYDRCFDAVWAAKTQIANDAHFWRRIGGETYTGNLAAGRLGQLVEKELGLG